MALYVGTPRASPFHRPMTAPIARGPGCSRRTGRITFFIWGHFAKLAVLRMLRGHNSKLMQNFSEPLSELLSENGSRIGKTPWPSWRCSMPTCARVRSCGYTSTTSAGSMSISTAKEDRTAEPAAGPPHLGDLAGLPSGAAADATEPARPAGCPGPAADAQQAARDGQPTSRLAEPTDPPTHRARHPAHDDGPRGKTVPFRRCATAGAPVRLPPARTADSLANQGMVVAA